jgi:hypothetical protein
LRWNNKRTGQPCLRSWDLEILRKLSYCPEQRTKPCFWIWPALLMAYVAPKGIIRSFVNDAKKQIIKKKNHLEKHGIVFTSQRMYSWSFEQTVVDENLNLIPSPFPIWSSFAQNCTSSLQTRRFSLHQIAFSIHGNSDRIDMIFRSWVRISPFSVIRPRVNSHIPAFAMHNSCQHLDHICWHGDILFLTLPLLLFHWLVYHRWNDQITMQTGVASSLSPWPSNLRLLLILTNEAYTRWFPYR